MERGLILPNNHAMADGDSAYIGECIAGFLADRGIA
jgi:hypothetical protein